MKPILPCVVVAIVALLPACATQPKEPPPKPFALTRWEVRFDKPPAGEKPWIRFADGRMEGFGGCNRIAARYVQDSVGAHAIAIGRIETGRHACDRSVQMVEDGWLSVLQMVSSYSITGGLMTMTGSAGTVSFHAAGEGGK